MHCIDQQFTIASLWVTRNSINEKPEYQRESAVWSKDKQQLFVDSVLNNFDVPKLYFHDLRGAKGIHDFAVVDGKQRLYTLYQFISGKLSLAEDFELYEQRPGQDIPKGGHKFAQLSEAWQEKFKAKTLAVVLIQNAEDEDIEELFSRLNNGEPLNAAEKRNAMGGDMCRLIKDVAKHKFFVETLKIRNNRFQHLEVSAKFIRLEANQESGGGMCADLKKRFLDKMVTTNRTMPPNDWTRLQKRVNEQLALMRRVFKSQDPLLNKQAYAPLFYIFIKTIIQEYGDPTLHTKIRKFLEKFQTDREENLEKPEEERDALLIEFGRLMQQGTNDLNSLEKRVSFLTRYFLLQHAEISVKDSKRLFTDEERTAIWILGGKKCKICDKDITLDEMHADHQQQWSHGGKTTLSNGRCLCVACNTAAGQTTE